MVWGDLRRMWAAAGVVPGPGAQPADCTVHRQLASPVPSPFCGEKTLCFQNQSLTRWTAMIGVQAKVKIKKKVGGRERKVETGRGKDPRLAIGMDLLKTKEI